MAEQIVEAGNQLFKEQKYAEAIERYTQALTIDSSSKMQIRVCNNRSQCHLFLKDYPKALSDATQVLELDPDNEKAYVRRAKAHESLNNLDAAYRDILEGIYRHPGCAALTNHKWAFAREHCYHDLVNLLQLAANVASSLVISTRILKKVEHQTYHDVWEVEDYFDPTNDFRKFDIPCPPDQFISNTQLIENETRHRNELAQQFTPVPSVDLFTEDRSDQTVINLNHKFAQGSLRPNGFMNVALAIMLVRMLKNKNVHLCFLAKDKTLKTVTGVGVKFGTVRCKSVTWHGIARGNVVVRDYDYHAWLSVRFSDEQEIDIDLMAAQFDHYTYLQLTKFPVRIFNESTLKQESDLGTKYQDFKGVYRPSSRQAPLWNDEIRQFHKNGEYKFEKQETERYFNAAYYTLENEFNKRNLLPKVNILQ